MIVQNKKKTDKIKKLPIKGKTLMVKKRKLFEEKVLTRAIGEWVRMAQRQKDTVVKSTRCVTLA